MTATRGIRAAPTVHRPSCACGGTGLLDGPDIDPAGSGRRYPTLVPCPAEPWLTPAPSSGQAARCARSGLAAARAALGDQQGTTAAPAQMELEL